jgi:hypothetical protein
MPEEEASPSLVQCPACGFENAATTLYCQDCGAKLEVAPPSYMTTAPPPSISAAPVAGKKIAPGKKVRIAGEKREIPLKGLLGITARTLFYALCMAVLIQLFRAPRDLPPAVAPMAAPVVTEVRAKFNEAARTGLPVDAPWARLNSYLAASLVQGPGEGGMSTSFVRAALLPRPGGFAVIIHKRSSQLPIYVTVDYRVISRTNGLDLEPTGAAIGRIPFPAWMAPVVRWVGGDLTAALSYELDIVKGAQRVDFSPATARMVFPRQQP